MPPSHALKLAERDAAREQREAEAAAERERRAALGAKLARTGERWRLVHGDLRELDLEAESMDAIVTDPPYNADGVALLPDLARLAVSVLRPGGSLVVMFGQFWLPAAYRALELDGLNYHWHGTYLTPGKATQIMQRRLHSNAKPLLWYVKGDYDGRTLGTDVFESVEAEKEHHPWGQSESGMTAVVEAFTEPGELVLDPFCGAGTTAVAALRLGRRIIGVDTDESSINLTRSRIAELEQEAA